MVSVLGGYCVRMLDQDGTLAAVSVTYPTRKEAKQGIALAREIAATGLVVDRTLARVTRTLARVARTE